MRYGRDRVDCEAGSPPRESVRSDKTMRATLGAAAVRVKSSSVPTSTLPRLDAGRPCTEPSVGRPELCISIMGCDVPSPLLLGRVVPLHAAAGDEDRVERRGLADRFWYGSRWRPSVA